ncbi:MAG: hypothetical protein ACP5NF_06205 [Thermoanaerobaculum sp.]
MSSKTRRCFSLLLSVAGMAAVRGNTATLSPATVPAGGQAVSLLTVPQFGRVSVAVRSPSGARVRVVDRMAGVVGEAGKEGEEDGRVDLFLERGSYRVEVLTPEFASGKVELSATEFRELASWPLPVLEEGELATSTLGDHEQRSFWLYVPEAAAAGAGPGASSPPRAQPVPIQVAGRALAEVRLWQGGVVLVEAPVTQAQGQWEGEPLRVLRLAPHLPPGWHLLTAYGGPPLPWSRKRDESPLFLEVGIPELAPYLRHRESTGPFGCAFFRVPGDQQALRWELPEPRDAQMYVSLFNPQNPFATESLAASMSKDTRDPVTQVRLPGLAESPAAVAVCAPQPQEFVLQTLARDPPSLSGESQAWAAVFPAGHEKDTPPATALLVSRSKEEVVASRAITVDTKTRWERSFNLMRPVTLVLHVVEDVSLRVTVTGAEGAVQVESLYSRERPVREKRWPATLSLPRGFFALTLTPSRPGLATVQLAAEGFLEGALRAVESALQKVTGGTPSSPPEEPAGPPWAQLGAVTLDPLASYALLPAGGDTNELTLVFRPYPLDLSRAFPAGLSPGEELSVEVFCPHALAVTVEAQDQGAVPFVADGQTSRGAVTLGPGVHRLSWKNEGASARLFVVRPVEVRAPPGGAPPKSHDELARSLPPVLPWEQTAIARSGGTGTAVFTLEVQTPGLFRVESQGPWRTAAVLRTRTAPVARAAANGTGDNFAIAAYLREGTYFLGVRGPSSWPEIPVRAAPCPIRDGGDLEAGTPIFVTLNPWEAVRLQFQVPSSGTYRLSARTLGGPIPCRLEDREGWPVGAPGGPCDGEAELAPGSYSLLLLPQDGEHKVVVELTQRAPEPALSGRGPHLLPLGKTLSKLWREPEEGQPREPDVFLLELAAPARVHLHLEGDMAGSLKGEAGSWPLHPGETVEKLPAGRYRVELAAARPNNMLPYSLRAETEELVPGSSREVVAPVTLPVSVGSAPLTEIFSRGDDDVRAELADENGRILATSDDAPNSWEFHLALPLSPGRYRLAVLPVGKERAVTRVVMAARRYTLATPLPAPGQADFPVARDVLDVPLAPSPGSQLCWVEAHAPRALGLVVAAATRTLATASGDRPEAFFIPPGDSPVLLRLYSETGQSAKATVRTWCGPIPETTVQANLALAPVGSSGWFGTRLRTPGGGVLETAEPSARLLSHENGQLLTPNEGVLVVQGSESVFLAKVDRVAAKLLAIEPGQALHFALPAGNPVPVPVRGVRGTALVVAKSFPDPVVVTAGLSPGESPWSNDGSVSATVAEDPALVWVAASGRTSTVEVSIQPLPPPQEAPAPAGETAGELASGNGVRARFPVVAHRLHLLLPAGTVAVSEGPTGRHVLLALEEAKRFELLAETEVVTLWSLREGGPFAVAAAPGENQGPGILEAGETREGFWRWPAGAGGFRRVALAPAPYPRKVRVWGAEMAPKLLRPQSLTEGDELDLGSGGGEVELFQGVGAVALWVGPERGASAPPPAVKAVALPAAFHVESRQAVRLAMGAPAVLQIAASGAVMAEVFQSGERVAYQLLPWGGSWSLPVATGETLVSLVCLVPPCGPVTLRQAVPHLLVDGPNPKRLVPPGEDVFWVLDVPAARSLGVGVRARPDGGRVRLLSGDGRVVGEGPLIFGEFPAGRYLLVVTGSEDGQVLEVQPVVVGLSQPPTTPPPDLVMCYQQLEAGLVPTCPPPPPPPREQVRLPWEQMAPPGSGVNETGDEWEEEGLEGEGDEPEGDGR